MLRQRPAPYVGTHILLRIDDAAAGRAFLRRLIPYIDSAAGWRIAANAWLAIGITYPGLEALGVPKDSLQSFPEAFRVGMAARARQLGDVEVNDPKNWDPPYGKGQVHMGISAFSDSEEKYQRALAIAHEQYEGFKGVTVLAMQEFGAQPGDRNSLGYKDGIDQPPIEGDVAPLPGQGRPIKAGEFILGYPGEAGVVLPMPEPDVLGRNGTFIGFRKYQSRVGAFNRFLRDNGSTEEERELLAAKLVGRWRSGAPLTLAPDEDNPAVGADPQRNNNFDYADDTHGRQVPFGSHIRRMNPRDTQLTRLTRRQHPSPHPARHHLWQALRSDRAVGGSRRDAAGRHLPVYERQGDGHDRIPSTRVDQRRRFYRRQRRTRSDRRPAGGRGDLHDPEGTRPATCPRHPDVQRAQGRRVFLHAEPQRLALARKLERRLSMSDHIDGPRSIGDPPADVTDLFAFTSPESPERTVLAMCVFPSAGESAVFSNVIDYAIAVRRVRLARLGSAAKFEPANDEIRFSFRFEVLDRDPSGKVTQRGTCTLPDGRKLSLTMNDENGSATPEGDVRVFAGLRSDPFYLAVIAADLRKVPNLLQHDNVLVMVVELDTRRVLDPPAGSLFGAIAETVPMQPPGLVSHPVARIDWVGKPEQTNIRLTNPGLKDAADIRDLWNQQKPFALSKELQPMFLQRLKDSFVDWDMRDGKADWTPEALAANAHVFLDDFLLFDVAKPITDQSHLEIEKSTINDLPYQTGGGRTVDANVIDILLTWLVNRDREFLQGGATQATKRGMKAFPYFATPNTDVQAVAESVDLAAPPDAVWSVIGQFNLDWHPHVAKVRLVGGGTGQLRRIETRDGREIVERLEDVDNAKRIYHYALVAGIPASHYVGTIEVRPRGDGCIAEWRVDFLADKQPDIVVRGMVEGLLKSGLGNLKSRFGNR